MTIWSSGGGVRSWDEIRRRLAAAAAARGDIAPTVAEKRRILEQRARLLSRRPLPSETPGERLEVVEFLFASDHYAIETAWVREVCRLKAFTPLPCTPPFILGLVNLRGEILCVSDIRRFFDLPEHGLTDLDKVIILRGKGMELGILADAIVGIRALARAGLQAAPPTFAGIPTTYLAGVTPDRLVVLDGGALLGERRLVVHEEVEIGRRDV